LLPHAALRATLRRLTSVGGVSIDRESPEPPSRQLEALIRARIASGDLKPGARLPALATMAQEYDMAVSTVQKALAALKDDGSIVTSPLGTFVAKRPPRP
jgi:GntR family transcriptional regulator